MYGRLPRFLANPAASGTRRQPVRYRVKRVARWLFEDSSGRIVVGQRPNATMWIVLAALVLSFVVPEGIASAVVRGILFVALSWWAIDEIVRGQNPWRRLLGAGTLIAMFLWLVIFRR